jgi:uncharacterized protein (DUF58 family)
MDRKDVEFRGVVRLTRIAVGYLVFTLVIGFAAINTGNNALYIGLSFMLGGLVISGVASKGGLKHIQIQYLGVNEAWVGQPVGGLIRAVNNSRIWNVRDVVLTSWDLESPVIFPVLPRRSTTHVEARFVFGRRGKASFRPAGLYTRYPFGLFLKKREARVSGEVLVFPRLFQRSSRMETMEVLRGEKARAEKLGPGSEIRAFREYVKGDSLRQVHWKKSASVGRWIMKDTELEANESIEIAVDPILPPGATEDQFEEMVSEAATLVRDALDGQLDVSLHTPAGSVRGGGDGARRPMFEALALVTASDESWLEWTHPKTVVFSLGRGHEQRTA